MQTNNMYLSQKETNVFLERTKCMAVSYSAKLHIKNVFTTPCPISYSADGKEKNQRPSSRHNSRSHTKNESACLVGHQR
jgi:hypothetical protein